MPNLIKSYERKFALTVW